MSPEPEVIFRIALHPRRKDRWSIVTADGKRAIASGSYGTSAEARAEFWAEVRGSVTGKGFELRGDDIVRVADTEGPGGWPAPVTPIASPEPG